ncbi:hypothetical protein [Nocardia sp. NPDC052566]
MIVGVFKSLRGPGEAHEGSPSRERPRNQWIDKGIDAVRGVRPCLREVVK